MDTNYKASGALAVAITKAASKQTYYTIRFFVDQGRVADAYRAYGYFRWVDDVIDAEAGKKSEKIAFVNRQKSLLEACYRGETPEDLCAEEWMLVDLVRNDTGKNSGLQSYLRNMMAVMVFDAERRGQIIMQAELSGYSRTLAVAVTEALYYFIGHNDPSPRHEARYLAVTAAHITHMLRDALEDVEAGYYNIPREYLHARGIAPQDVNSPAYREWVCGRVQLARLYFKAGRECTAQVQNLRCRLAGFAYTARFEWMLRAIERDHYCLRSAYPERKSLRAGLWMAWLTLSSMFTFPRLGVEPRALVIQPVRIKER
ncbi:MAG: squalene/phytoene synthase family protein [Anaerolineales bacterium]|nr:squalene/phytoene synthase family protein [Anaerolineales bacterium]